MKKSALFFLLFVAACVSAQGKTDSDLFVKSELEKYLWEKYQSFRITEIYERDTDAKGFLSKSIGESLLKEAAIVKKREFLFARNDSRLDAHLGVMVVVYSNSGDAKKAAGSVEITGFLNETKILTRYVIKQFDKELLIVYSESVAHEDVSEFIKNYESEN